MKKHFVNIFLAMTAVIAVAGSATAQTRPAFPQNEGVSLNYRHTNASNKHDADFTITLRNVTGNNSNGHLDLVYNCFDENGKPYFNGNNEFIIGVDRKDDQTYITMDKMAKTIKAMDLISAGDVSSIQVPMNVGDALPDTKIFTTLAAFKATLTISEKKVLERKEITVNGKSYDCWLVHEKILTKTPFSTDTATADTWYAEGVGCVSQTVYDAKGKLKGRLELVSTGSR